MKQSGARGWHLCGGRIEGPETMPEPAMGLRGLR